MTRMGATGPRTRPMSPTTWCGCRRSTWPCGWICLSQLRTKLLAPLSAIYRDLDRPETERSLATDILAEYAADQLSLLADLLMDADLKQFPVIYDRFKDQGRGGPGLF